MLRIAPLTFLLALLAAPLAAQASPYVALDDPLLPAVEHLIRRGEIDDPSPMVRPFRRLDLIRALDSAVVLGRLRDTALAAEFRHAWADPDTVPRWDIEGQAGFQAYTEARRDPLHPAGIGSINPYLSLRLQGIFGPVVVVTRPAIEPRLTNDPDWPGRKDIVVSGQFPEAYVSAQWKWVKLFYGQVDREWRPQEFSGIGLSALGYARPDFGFEVGVPKFHLTSHSSTLRNVTDSTGEPISRYFFAHRFHAQVSKRVTLGLWETVVLSGPSRSFDARYRNPMTLLLLGNEYGLGDDGNVLLGLDFQWRFARATTLTAQVGLDDFQYKDKSSDTSAPDRYAFAVSVRGPIGPKLGWYAGYSQASSLAFHTADPFEALTEADVGIGRTFPDNDQFLLGGSWPVTSHWLVSPELTLLRQGQGRITDPWPTDTALGNTPTLFIGTVERTWRAAVSVSGRQGPVALSGQAGLHYVENAGHNEGDTETRFVGRVQATLYLGWKGKF
ncbi:MAG: hypothetical protein OEW17_08595 [Gemmatimonadota bacterium]|nr:hypothetical protein [Gemmatimonadota bacterium]